MILYACSAIPCNSILFHIPCLRNECYNKKVVLHRIYEFYSSISLIERLKWDENTYKLPLAVRQNGRSLFTLPWLMYCIKISKYTIYIIMPIGNLSFVQTPFLRILLVVNGRNVKMHYFCLAVIAFLQDFNSQKPKERNRNQ